MKKLIHLFTILLTILGVLNTFSAVEATRGNHFSNCFRPDKPKSSKRKKTTPKKPTHIENTSENEDDVFSSEITGFHYSDFMRQDLEHLRRTSSSSSFSNFFSEEENSENIDLMEKSWGQYAMEGFVAIPFYSAVGYGLYHAYLKACVEYEKHFGLSAE